MKARSFSFLFVFLLLAAPAASQVRSIPSSITSVTVYSDRAAVTRSGQVSLQAGTYQLAFSNLPVSIFDNSVRVSGEAGGAKILDVRVETAFLDTIPEERIRSLQLKISELQIQQNEMGDRIAVLSTERDFINQIKAQTADNISKDLKVQRPTVEDWQKVLSFFDSNLNKILAEQRKLTKERADLQNKIDALQRQLSAIAPSRRSVKNIIVEVQVTRVGDVRLSPIYVVRGARWYPHYDARVSTETRQVEFRYYGMVQQSTGEDWTNAALTLSTARPDVGGSRPELPPWYVNIAPPLPVMNKPMRAGEGAGLKKEADVEMALSETALPMEEPAAAVETQVTSALFRIAAPSTIPSDNVAHRVTVAVEKLPAEFSYSSTPKLSPFAYLKAVIRNTTDYPLLSGGVNIFSNDDFVSTSSLATISPNETFDSYLGVDQSIKVERKLVNRSTEYTGTFTDKTKVVYEYLFSVENTKRTEQVISVQDQLPVSQNEKIVVEALDPPARDLKKDDRGIITWNPRLGPGEKKSWKLKFSVEYPQGTPVTGLE